MSSLEARKFLTAVSENFAFRILNHADLRTAASSALDQTERWHKRDCPLKPLLVIWLLISMTFFRTLSIPNAFRRLLAGSGPGGLPFRPVTPEALWRARERLGSEPIRLLFRRMAQQPVPKPSFLGLRVYGVDGCYFTIPDTPANVAVFGKKGSDRGEAAYPQILGVLLVDLSNHRLRDCVFSDCHGSERDGVHQLLGQLGPGDLLMMDRGISSYRVLLDCQERGVAYLARISSTWKPNLVKTLGSGDCLVDIKPSRIERSKMEKEGLKTPTLRVRLISFQIGDGETVRLLTSLLDPARYPALKLAAGYHQRWECELSYKEIKVYLTAVTHGKQHTVFRSKNPDACLQEAWAMALTYNLVRDLMVEAAQMCDPPISPLHLSFVDTVEVLKLAQTELQAATPAQLPGLLEKLLRAVAACRIDRPRRKRAYPRKVKRKMSNFGKKGPDDKQMRWDFAAKIRLV
jgi:hypothetical protein